MDDTSVFDTIEEKLSNRCKDRGKLMDYTRVFWGIVAIIGALGPSVGMIIGNIRYKRNGNEIRRKVKEEYKNAQEAGGIKSLYYKHEQKRVFSKTFGTPILIGLLVGLILLFVAFHNL